MSFVSEFKKYEIKKLKQNFQIKIKSIPVFHIVKIPLEMMEN